MKRFDFHDPSLEGIEGAPDSVDTREAYITEALGAEHLSGSVYEIAPGLKGFPYHWEAAKEEWLLVLEGTPTVRSPEGEHELRPGDLVCFPTGPEGAHQVLNRSAERVRFIWLSNAADPNVIVYPDSGKVGVRGNLGLPGGANYPIDSSLDYWEGES
jgi:uncharacterized cupin superfamily protein